MSDEEKQETPKKEKPASSGGGIGSMLMKSLLIVVLVVVASVGGGVVSYVLISQSGALNPASAPAADEGHHDTGQALRDLLEKGAVLDLEPFVVNLADTDSPRYLRVSVTLMVDDKAAIGHGLEPTVISKTRDVILQTLSRKKSSEIIDEEGKNNLRTEILERLEPIFHHPRVVDVMFTEFVIQL